MPSSSVAAVVNYFPTANEGYITTLQTTIAPGAVTVGLGGIVGLTNGTIFVGIIEPGGAKQQVFTGTVDTVGSQITGVVWTRGANVTHTAGVTIVDYTTGTAMNMIAAGILKFTTQTGRLIPTTLWDVNGNKTLLLPATVSAVNQLSINNAVTAVSPSISVAGTDVNIGLNFVMKGSDIGQGLQYNGTPFRALSQDWTRALVATQRPFSFQSTGTWGLVSGPGWIFPGDNALWWESPNLQNSEIRYKIYLDAGTYTMTHYYRQFATAGIVTWGWITEQGVTVNQGGGTDLYVATGSSQVSTVSTGLNVSQGAYYSLFFKTATKNASSTGYILPYFGTQILRTA